MERIMFAISSTVISVSLWLGQSFATQPGADVNPNGFPSGPHYNLNIIGKKAEFTCPEQNYDEYGNPIYGNVVFVPEDGQGIQIIMQSGKGAKAAAIPELQVTDPCASAFDSDAAVLQLPKNDAGYRVYARALAKPTGNPDISITPDLVFVQDELGNDLILLGLVTSNGFETPYRSVTRTKGKSTALDITGLFLWSGDVCYFADTLCGDSCTDTQLCCVPGDANGDTVVDPNEYISCDEVPDGGICALGSTLVDAYCRTYTNEWVFNIADFVEYLWDLDNNGVKLLQVRFYPN